MIITVLVCTCVRFICTCRRTHGFFCGFSSLHDPDFFFIRTNNLFTPCSNIVDVNSYGELKEVIAEGKWARGPWSAR